MQVTVSAGVQMVGRKASGIQRIAEPSWEVFARHLAILSEMAPPQKLSEPPTFIAALFDSVAQTIYARMHA